MAEELEWANARRPCVSDEIYGLGTEALANRTRAVIASAERSAMFLYQHSIRAKSNDEAFGSKVDKHPAELGAAVTKLCAVRDCPEVAPEGSRVGRLPHRGHR